MPYVTGLPLLTYVVPYVLTTVPMYIDRRYNARIFWDLGRYLGQYTYSNYYI